MPQHSHQARFFCHICTAHPVRHSPVLLLRTSCWASATRVGISIVAFFENYIGTGVTTPRLRILCTLYLHRPARTSDNTHSSPAASSRTLHPPKPRKTGHRPVAFHRSRITALPLRTSYFVPRTSCWASITRMGISVAAFFENFLGTGVICPKKYELRGGQ